MYSKPPRVEEKSLASPKMFDGSDCPRFARAHKKKMAASFEKTEHLLQTMKKNATLSPATVSYCGLNQSPQAQWQGGDHRKSLRPQLRALCYHA
jgi:hypothetical protein